MPKLPLEISHYPALEHGEVLQTDVGGLLRGAAQKYPNDVALTEVDFETDASRSWTYEELLADSEKLALAFSTRYPPGARLCVWAPNIPEWVLVEYACALAGLVLVTANPAYQPKELRYVLEQSKSAGLFMVGSFRGNPMAEIASEAAKDLPDLIEVVDMEDHAALFSTADRPAHLPDVKPSDIAQMQFTSGTTGFPKGALLHHLGLTNNARFGAERAGVNQSSVWVNFMPMFHTAGCAMITLGALQVGCEMLIVKQFEPTGVVDLIERKKITMAMGVPTMFVAMAEILDTTPRDMSSMKMIVVGGAMVAPDLVRKVKESFGCDFETVYGQTETSPVLTQHHANDSADDISNTAGRPLPHTGISIRSTADNSVMPIDEVGEICAQGYVNMAGYNANPKATAETIDSDGWLHTGDLGTMDARGYLRVTGRVKEMIIRGGENLFPAEIENTLLEHPDVVEVAVVGIPDDKWGEVVACFFRLTDGAMLNQNALRAHCRANMSAQKTPSLWFNVSEFPLTGSGKIQRFELRNGYLAGKYTAL